MVTYFAELTKQTVKMQEDLRNQQKELRAEKKERAEKAEKMKEEKADKADKKPDKDAEKPVNPNKVTASTIEELTAKLKELLAERTANKTEENDGAKEEAKQERPHFDMTL